jgi:hypothetical protein
VIIFADIRLANKRRGPQIVQKFCIVHDSYIGNPTFSRIVFSLDIAPPAKMGLLEELNLKPGVLYGDDVLAVSTFLLAPWSNGSHC